MSSRDVVKRAFDLLAVIPSGMIVLPLSGLIVLLVWITSPGPVLYWSDRVGRGNKLFRMPKFRTMRLGAPVVATHLLENPEEWVTPLGSFLRKTSLDELPQLWCVLTGSMSLVGPRPALFNQQDLVDLRTRRGVHRLTPGLTGWAQVNGRDGNPLERKVALDVVYLRNHGACFDLLIVVRTLAGLFRPGGISH